MGSSFLWLGRGQRSQLPVSHPLPAVAAGASCCQDSDGCSVTPSPPRALKAGGERAVLCLQQGPGGAFSLQLLFLTSRGVTLAPSTPARSVALHEVLGKVTGMLKVPGGLGCVGAGQDGMGPSPPGPCFSWGLLLLGVNCIYYQWGGCFAQHIGVQGFASRCVPQAWHTASLAPAPSWGPGSGMSPCRSQASRIGTSRSGADVCAFCVCSPFPALDPSSISTFPPDSAVGDVATRSCAKSSNSSFSSCGSLAACSWG